MTRWWCGPIPVRAIMVVPTAAAPGSEDEAVLLSRALGRPVRVQWMRADDMQWSSNSPAMVSDIRIALDDTGRIAGYQRATSRAADAG